MTRSWKDIVGDFLGFSKFSSESSTWEMVSATLTRDVYDRDPAAFTFRKGPEIKRIYKQTERTLTAFNTAANACRADHADYTRYYDLAMAQSDLCEKLKVSLRAKMEKAKQAVAP